MRRKIPSIFLTYFQPQQSVNNLEFRMCGGSKGYPLLVACPPCPEEQGLSYPQILGQPKIPPVWGLSGLRMLNLPESKRKIGGPRPNLSEFGLNRA